MKHSLLLSLATLLFVGCTSTSRVSLNEPIPTTAASITPPGESTQQFGAVVVTMDGNGKWLQLVSVGSAALVNDTPKGQDDAMRRARAAAYQNIVKFMGNHVTAKTVNKAYNDDDAISHSSTDVTTESAAGLIKGATFDQQYVEGDHAVARATVTPKTIDTASQVRAAMLRSMQEK